MKIGKVLVRKEKIFFCLALLTPSIIAILEIFKSDQQTYEKIVLISVTIVSFLLAFFLNLFEDISANKKEQTIIEMSEKINEEQEKIDFMIKSCTINEDYQDKVVAILIKKATLHHFPSCVQYRKYSDRHLFLFSNENDGFTCAFIFLSNSKIASFPLYNHVLLENEVERFILEASLSAEGSVDSHWNNYGNYITDIFFALYHDYTRDDCVPLNFDSESRIIKIFLFCDKSKSIINEKSDYIEKVSDEKYCFVFTKNMLSQLIGKNKIDFSKMIIEWFHSAGIEQSSEN